ncbi:MULTISPECIES: transketolase [Thiorhodovibrio]|uniref:transketolase n=1 Tax=Thiorhodovibrio TaxID=61593 RepID=UPI001913E289|nr:MULTISPECIES: transketolase [Thiorhodovibrio]MBK5969135.1 transketolase [Thiorhodovibrio winogradskyi]WPL13392.1 Transketolase 1 [Thiorhodovibrio litoralis]
MTDPHASNDPGRDAAPETASARPDAVVDPALSATAARLRAHVLRMTTTAGSGHPTSALSAAELVSALFFQRMRWDPSDPGGRDQDRFLLSKGHAAPILWAALHEAGALDESPETLRQLDSTLEGHPSPRNPWVPALTGSLGQGLSIINGMALANRFDGIDARLYCLLGDGECSEGSVWESAQFAAAQRLGAITALVDANGLQQSGPSPTANEPDRLAERFRAFGWSAEVIDGHDLDAIVRTLSPVDEEQPRALIARTVKGQGVSFLAGADGWHGKALSAEECEAALNEIQAPAQGIQITPRRVPVSPPPALAPAAVMPPVQPASPQPERRGELAATRSGFGSALARAGARREDLIVLDGDVRHSTKTQAFAAQHPDRFIDAGIAEQNMIGTALGLAVSGKRPCVSSFAAFLSRGYDFLRMAAHSRPPHLLVVGSHAGVSIGEDGASQMGLEDIAMFRALDGATVLYPSDAVSAERLTEQALEQPGLTYLRTTRGKTPVLYESEEAFPIGGSKTLIASDQDRLTLVAAGVAVSEALDAHVQLLESGVPTRVIDAYSIEPLDVETLLRAGRETGGLLVVEDHHLNGGLGDAVAARVGRETRVFRLGVTGEPHSGTPAQLRQRHRLSGKAIERAALAMAA